jgi:argininosuccinate lyase
VKTASTRGIDLAALSLDELRAFDARIENDVFEVLSLEGSLNARSTLGGTAPSQVRAQVARHRSRLG